MVGDVVFGLFRRLRAHRAVGHEKARFGAPHDGGYVMIDDFAGIDAAFSFGIADDASWDVAIADRGIPVFQFDHTVSASPVTHPNLVFAQQRIVPRPAPDCQTIGALVWRHVMRFRETESQSIARTMFVEEPSLILKMDIEGDEWDVLDEVSAAALRCFTQIVVEFHNFGSITNSLWLQRARRVFNELADQFSVVHVHGNNFGGVVKVDGVLIPETLELTFANKRRYQMVPSDEQYPGLLDAPNCPGVPDLYLGRFAFE